MRLFNDVFVHCCAPWCFRLLSCLPGEGRMGKSGTQDTVVACQDLLGILALLDLYGTTACHGKLRLSKLVNCQSLVPRTLTESIIFSTKMQALVT